MADLADDHQPLYRVLRKGDPSCFYHRAPALVAVLIKANAEGRLEAYRREISSEMSGSAEA